MTTQNDDLKNDWDTTYKHQKDFYGIKPTFLATRFVDYLNGENEIRILELGSGEGRDTVYVAQKMPLCRICALDISSVALTSLQSKFNLLGAQDRLETAVADFTFSLSFDDAQFDAALSCNSLHFFNHETTTFIFREIRRVIKPGGIFGFNVYSVGDEIFGFGDEIEKNVFIHKGKMRHFFDGNEIKTILGFDFKILEMKEYEEEIVSQKFIAGKTKIQKSYVVVAEKVVRYD